MNNTVKIIISIFLIFLLSFFVLFFIFAGNKSSESNKIQNDNFINDLNIPEFTNDSFLVNINDNPEVKDVPPMFDIDSYLEKLNIGEIVFNTPKSMKVKEKFVINLIILPQNDISIKILDGNISRVKIKIDKKMEAILIGSGFEIINITEPIQAVSLNDQTIWKWEISALESGDQLLCLNLNIKIEIEGEKISRSIKTFEKKIKVKVSNFSNSKRFIINNWQYILSSVAVPIIASLWRYRKNKKYKIINRSRL